MIQDHTKTTFQAGRNIAMKVPPHHYEATVAFYRDVLGMPHLGSEPNSEIFAFGTVRLWIDRVARLSQSEIWLEVQSDDMDNAADRLKQAGVVRCDDIEPLPEGLDSFWISNPTGIIHLVNCSKEALNSQGDICA